MARKVKWYTVTSPRSQTVQLRNGVVKQVHSGGRFEAVEKKVRHLLRTGVIRELAPREIAHLAKPKPKPKPRPDNSDSIVILDN